MVYRRGVNDLMAKLINKPLEFSGFERPDIVQKLLHSVRVTIWCAISSHGIINIMLIRA